MDIHLQKYNLHQITTTLILTTLLLAKDLVAESGDPQIKAETRFDPFHLSWTTKTTRYDFVFSINGTFKNLVKLDSDPDNFLTNSLNNCTDYSACLFRNGTHLESFHVGNTSVHESVFSPAHAPNSAKSVQTSASANECDTGNKLKITHYCSTHWNPPIHLVRVGCSHYIEWHSPITCHPNSTNHEKPCYIYDSSGKLVDLTPWILSNGSSYKVDTSNDSTIKQFNLNVCNEAHDRCGPNVAACFLDHSGTVESGYNNLTSIKYDSREQTALLTYLGHYREHCGDSRIKTVIRFICKNKIIADSRPKLIRSTVCENTIEWPSIHACPISDITAPERDCNIKYKPFGIDIDIKKLTSNQALIEIPGLRINGQDKKIIFGICQPIPKTYECEGKINSNTKACLVDADDNSTKRTANNSMIVGSFSNSLIRLSNEKIFLESYAINHTCSETVREDFNVTQQVGTRVEFFCSRAPQQKPAFLGYDDCTYVFEWGSPLVCLEAFAGPTNTSEPKQTKESLRTKAIEQLGNINVKDVIVSKELNSQVKKVAADHSGKLSDLHESNSQSARTDQPRMNDFHKFFMISLIVGSFAAFIVVIFVLDKKTRLRVKIRQARQVFQSNNQQLYSRVIDDLDL